VKTSVGDSLRNTDADWELFAQRDPYWAVLTASEFLRDNLDETSRAAFFRNGEATIAHVMQTLQKYFGCRHQFEVALDFGCGVGRLLFPLARRSRLAIGVDVSPSMLEECGKNAARFEIGNAILRRSDDELTQVQEYRGKVELLNSLLVLQHIPPSRGLGILGRLLDLLRPTCFGAIQLVAGAARGESAEDAGPVMEMNPYDLNAVISMLHARGIEDIYCRLENHDGLVGVVLYFHRKQG
jgi:SAM-dependent methyltransferase